MLVFVVDIESTNFEVWKYKVEVFVVDKYLEIL